MAQCEKLNTCEFFTNNMADMPTAAEKVKKFYCHGASNRCARLMVSKICGKQNVPADLYPNMVDVAQEIIRDDPSNSGRFRRPGAAQFLDKLELSDIYNFACDLSEGAREFMAEASSRATDGRANALAKWITRSEEEHASSILKMRIQSTGERSRKRTKNALHPLLEKFRLGKQKLQKYGIKYDAEEICDIFYTSIHTRMILMGGLTKKTTREDIRTILMTILAMDKKRLEHPRKELLEKFAEVYHR